MQVKGKIFPYPVINHNKNFSNFAEHDFKIVFETSEDSNAYVLKNCYFETESNLINNLYKEGKIEILLIIECSDTVYRKSFVITKSKQDFKLQKVDFTEKVDISMFAYAKEKLYSAKQS